MPCHLCSSEIELTLAAGPTFWGIKETKRWDAYQNLNSSRQQWRSHLGEISFFPKGGQTKEQHKYGLEKFPLPNHLPHSPLLPLSPNHFGLDFHHFQTHNNSQLWQGQDSQSPAPTSTHILKLMPDSENCIL